MFSKAKRAGVKAQLRKNFFKVLIIIKVVNELH